MSSFEITVTPTRFKKHMESREPTDVVMAPFSTKAIVQFEDVPLTKTAKRILRIINPSDDDIEVKVTKSIPPEHNITIDWMEQTVSAHNSVEMEMIWNPQIDVACKETLQLTDNRNFRKDIMIILKSKINKPAKNTRKYPTISSGVKNTHKKILHLKSPTNNRNKTCRSITPTQQAKLKKTEKSLNMQKDIKSQQLTQNINANNAKIPATKTHITQISPLMERNTFMNARRAAILSGTHKSPLLDSGSDVSKENISPLTPSNMLNMIDNLNFTPATSTATESLIKCENLALLPTPVAADYADECKNFRPRRLTDLELGHAEVLPKIEIQFAEVCELTSAITNKTFEVKINEGLETSMDVLDEVSLMDNARLSIGAAGIVLNKTTTIVATPMGRQLEMIAEEETHFPIVTSPADNTTTTTASKLQATYIQNSEDACNEDEDLKRDIKLIGTPLRKYSESMQNLSLRSPQNKYAIQGSMPNLNEMEKIRSIEHNRYFYQSISTTGGGEGKVSRLSAVKENTNTTQVGEETQQQEYVADELNTSGSIVMAELLFNQNEILAQSSRFNLNEIGLRSRKNSPITSKSPRCAAATVKKSPMGKTPPKAMKKISLPASDVIVKAGVQKRFLHELSFSDSPSVESISSSCSSTITASASSSNIRNLNKSASMKVSPPKRQRIDSDAVFQRPAPLNASASRVKNWSQLQPKKFKLAKTLSLVKKPITPRKCKDEPRVKLYDSDIFLQSYINPDPFAATTTCDPFLASTMYLDERAVDKHQADFKKWLNALVTMPADLDTDVNVKVDVGKLFNEVRHKELILAPTKEEQCMNYLTKIRLESLRRAAVQLFLSEEMREPCSKVAVYVNKNAIRIRNDRNLHLDVVMQRYILELLLCFNPLWLRLGLEVVYGEKLHLHSNNDIVGLSTFILNRLFRDKFLEQKYSKAYTLSDEYAEHIKKFTLQKFLFLLLFLDKAKTHRIVKHNPCLFVKKSPHKETKDILLKFSSELLANIGDITRELRRLGYVLQHKQTFLDEFDYAFNNLAIELRDGIRLTRVMEVILLRENLSNQLRVPAISRLQRIYNVNLALRALSEANFELKGDITAADIVDGHREKTLSLLWQIIYKFRSPKFHAAARIIQQWWRHSWLRVVIKRRIRRKEELRREMAATKIQSTFRGYITRKYVQVFREERCQAAVILQKYIRSFLARKKLHRAFCAIILLQRWHRSLRQGAAERHKFLLLRSCTITIQRSLRRHIFAKKLLRTAEMWRLQHAQKMQAAACCIQYYWLAYRCMKEQRLEYLTYRHHVITVQRRFRARKVMQQQQNTFVYIRRCAILVQRRFRANREMFAVRQEYLHMRKSIIALQRRRRALIAMRPVRETFLEQRNAVIVLQRRYRATLAMRKHRASYVHMLGAIKCIQQQYRALKAMQQQRNAYQLIRQRIICIQQKWRATLLARRTRVDYISLQYYTTVLQQKYRSKKLMHSQRAEYEKLKLTVTKIQRRFRAKLLAQQERRNFQCKMAAIITLQQRFRAYKQMRFMRAKYRGTMTAIICLQQHIRSYLLMKHTRSQFLATKHAVIVVQRKYRARLAMKKQRSEYNKLRTAALSIQGHLRATFKMHEQKKSYCRQLELIRTMQRRFRAKLLARRQRKEYLDKRTIVIKLQRRFRATKLMRETRADYLNTRTKIIKIQRYFRCRQQMLQDQNTYLQKKLAITRIKCWYKGILLMRMQQKLFEHKRSSALKIQQWWRATLAAHHQQKLYQKTQLCIIRIQCALRAILAMRRERQQFQRQRWAACVLQCRFRARCEMLKVRNEYLLIRSLIICVQHKYRAHRAMLQQRSEFLQLQRVTLHLQQKFRGHKQMQNERHHFLLLRSSVVNFQTHFRGFVARKRFQESITPEMKEIMRQKRAAKIIQRYWRGYLVRKRWQNVRIVLIRKNIKLLKETSKAMNTIRYKMLDAVRILRSPRCNLAETLNVLKCLDRLSRTVPHLFMNHINFISTFCYSIMAQAIRSEADKQVICYCSRIILNLARYNNTTANTFQEEGLRTVAQMLMRWCDKDCEIFNTLCTLIWIFAHCPIKREIIHDYMTTPEAIFLVRETKKLVARKEKMKQNVRKPIITNRRADAVQNFSSRALPSLTTDYGVIYNKPYTFISSVYAFDTILCKLGIDII